MRANTFSPCRTEAPELSAGSWTGDDAQGGGALCLGGKPLLAADTMFDEGAISHGFERGVKREDEGARVGSGGWSLMSLCMG